MNKRELDELFTRHVAETADGQLDCAVNELARGQSTLRHHYILKVDIVNSTMLLRGRQAQTYVRLVHPFFSTLDAICRSWGADSAQTEYHGDSVLALFPDRGNTAMDVLAAAVQCHYVCKLLARESTNRREFGIRTRTVLHYGPLSVTITGPYGESHRVAVGIPIHDAAKREKEVAAGTIWASDAFTALLSVQERASYMRRQRKTETVREQVRVEPPAPPMAPLSSLLGLGAAQPQQHSALSLAGSYLSPPSPHSARSLADQLIPRYEWRDVSREVNDGWTVALPAMYRDLRLPEEV